MAVITPSTNCNQLGAATAGTNHSCTSATTLVLSGKLKRFQFLYKLLYKKIMSSRIDRSERAFSDWKRVGQIKGLKKELNFKFFSEIFRRSLKTSEIKEDKKSIWPALERKKQLLKVNFCHCLSGRKAFTDWYSSSEWKKKEQGLKFRGERVWEAEEQ